MRPMRMTLIAAWAVVFAAALMLAGTGEARAAGTSAGPPRAALTGFSCRPAVDPGSRAIAATAVMRPVGGTRHMAIRFDLLSQGPDGKVTAIRGGDLGQFTSPANSTLGQLPADVWRVDKLVVPLAVPAVYRLRAEFRWSGAGRVLSTATRLSPDCRQRELRPDLVVRLITVTPVPQRPDRNLYTVEIANTGNSATGPFSVLFAPADGSAASSRQVGSIPAHSQLAISFLGPRCTSASAPTITADSALQVLDYHRSDNALVTPCLAISGA